MESTFNQRIAACLAIISLIALIAVYFIPAWGDPNSKTQTLTAIGGTLSACIIFLMKASSDAQHAVQMNQMTEALKNSQPIAPLQSPIQNIAPVIEPITPEETKNQ